MSEAIQLSFDYSQLDDEVRDNVIARRDHIRELSRRIAADILAIGRDLIAVKAQLGHGQFGAWLKAEFNWSWDTANRFMRVYRQFGEITQAAEFDAQALYVLSGTNVPETARSHALVLADEGEHISPDVARMIIAYQMSGDGNDEDMTPPSKINDGMRSSASAKWNTPAHILERVLGMWQEIDLDPCSNSHESPNVPALAHFTEADDGLVQAWHGYVFMNPPYGKTIVRWVEKVIAEYQAGRVATAIALVPARVDTGWWEQISRYPVCFLRGRLRFSGAKNSAPFPSAVVYIGDDLESFVAEFAALGAIYVPAPLVEAE